MDGSIRHHIIDVINRSGSKITIGKKSEPTFSKPILDCRSEKVNTDFFDIIFEFHTGQRVVFRFIEREGAEDHIDVEVGHPDNEIENGD